MKAATAIGKRATWLARVILCFSFAASIACRGAVVQPIDIAEEDTCSYCRMAISEKRYSAEFIDRDGQAFKFDDIGCMAQYLKEQKSTNDIAAYFVSDFDSRRWLTAADAVLLRSKKLNTPMGFGIVAFKERAAAEQAAQTYQGELLDFGKLIGK